MLPAGAARAARPQGTPGCFAPAIGRFRYGADVPPCPPGETPVVWPGYGQPTPLTPSGAARGRILADVLASAV